jgi:S1-C subfamily serine protease
LSSSTPFEGRPEGEAQWWQIQADIARVEQKIESSLAHSDSAPPVQARRALIGLAGCLALVGLVCWLAWPRPRSPSPSPSRGVRNSGQPIANGGTAGEKEKKGQPPTRRLGQLFLQLAPAVPLVEAVETGTGSGFLIRRDGKYLVVTNRHVVENARKGVAIHFPLKDDTRFTIPANKTSVVAIHRTADLAVLDVTGEAAQLERLRIVPVQLSKPEERPRVGDHVFAIGHPVGDGAVLTSTLSDGIVSAVGRPRGAARYLQVTAPINPGNSGGPLFDDEGRVVGVNTFTIRKKAGGETTLEALNFALQVEFVERLLAEPGTSLDAKEISDVLNPPPAEQTPAMTQALTAKLKQLAVEGYKPLRLTDGKDTLVVRLPPEKRIETALVCAKGEQYAIVTVSEGVADVDLGVLDRSKAKFIARFPEMKPDPDLKFQVDAEGMYFVLVGNPTDTAALVAVAVLKK